MSRHPTDNFFRGQASFIRSLNFVQLNALLVVQVTRLRKSGHFARNALRNPVLIEMVSVENSPARWRSIK